MQTADNTLTFIDTERKNFNRRSISESLVRLIIHFELTNEASKYLFQIILQRAKGNITVSDAWFAKLPDILKAKPELAKIFQDVFCTYKKINALSEILRKNPSKNF